jgi:serine/threonine protein kinase
MERSSTFEVGCILQTARGPYQIIDSFCRTLFSQLFLVCDQCGSRYMLKLVDPNNPQAVLTEQQAHWELRGCPFLFVTRDWLEIAGTRGFFTPFCDDGNIRIFSTRIQIQLLTLSRLVRQICRGLSFIHERGWVHRDIKPSNILMYGQNDQLPVAMISDFGLATRLTDAGVAGAAGTPGYIAPEIVRNEIYNEKVDIWSLGVTVFELATHRAFEERDIDEIWERAGLAGGRFAVADVDPTWRAFWDLIAHLLDEDPTLRFSAAEALDHTFLRVEFLVDDAFL